MRIRKNDLEASAFTLGQKNFLRRQKLQRLYIFWSRILIIVGFVMQNSAIVMTKMITIVIFAIGK